MKHTITRTLSFEFTYLSLSLLVMPSYSMVTCFHVWYMFLYTRNKFYAQTAFNPYATCSIYTA